MQRILVVEIKPHLMQMFLCGFTYQLELANGHSKWAKARVVIDVHLCVKPLKNILHQTGLFLTTVFIQQRPFLLFCREKMIQAYEFAIEKIGLDYSSYPVSVFLSQAKFLQFLNSPSSKSWIFQNPLLPKFSIGNRRCRYIAYILTYFLFEHLKNSPF